MIPTRHRYDFCSACALSRQNSRSWKFSGTRRSRDTERKANNFGPTWGSRSLMIQEFIHGHALPTEQRVGQDAPTGRCHILAILAYRLPSGFQTNLIIWSTQETQRCEIKGDAYRNCSMISAPRDRCEQRSPSPKSQRHITRPLLAKSCRDCIRRLRSPTLRFRAQGPFER